MSSFFKQYRIGTILQLKQILRRVKQIWYIDSQWQQTKERK